MKRWIAVVLTALMVLAMAACGNQEAPKSDLKPNPTTESTQGTTEATQNTTEATEPEETEKKDTVSLGRMQGGVYTNT